MTAPASSLADRLQGFRPPRQERSRRTLDRIARATESLLSERGAGAVTVNDVVARADTSVGAFYTRFDSRDDAVAYVRERSWEEARERWNRFLAPAAWRDVPADTVIAEVIRRFCRILLAKNEPSRAFYLDLLQRGGEAGVERVRRLDSEIAGLMGALLRSRARELDVADPSTTAADGFRRVISAVRDHLLFGPEGEERPLILSLVRMYSGLFGLEPPGSYAELLARCATARRLRVDFSFASAETLERIARDGTLPEWLEGGYEVLVDKDGTASELPAPSGRAHVPDRPSEGAFRARVEEFWWETLYVAKHLARGEPLAARYSAECVMRFACLVPMLAWHVQVGSGWSTRVGPHGRGVADRLAPEERQLLEETYAGPGLEAQWEALFAATRLFERSARRVAADLGHVYPEELGRKVGARLRGMR